MTKSIAANWNPISALEHTLGAEIEEDAVETWSPRNARTWSRMGALGQGMSWNVGEMTSTDTVGWTPLPGMTHEVVPHNEDATGAVTLDVYAYGQSFEVRVTVVDQTTSTVTQTTFPQALGSYAEAIHTITLGEDAYIVSYEFRKNGPATGTLLALIPRETIRTGDVP